MALQDDASLITSASLLQKARAQEPEAWRRLCQLYAPLIYGWVRKTGISENDAPDIVQEVFRSVAQHLHLFRSDRPGDNFRGWLITITRTEICAFLRRKSKQPQPEGGTTAHHRLQELPDHAAEISDPEFLTDSEADRRQVIRRAAEIVQNDFAPQTWQAFWRSVVENQPPDVIAAELQMTTNAIRQARFRVLNRLREILADCESFSSQSQPPTSSCSTNP